MGLLLGLPRPSIPSGNSSTRTTRRAANSWTCSRTRCGWSTCRHIRQPAFYASLPKAQKFLRDGLKRFATSYGMGTLGRHRPVAHRHRVALAHPRDKRKCGRTFATVLDLLDRYPEFTFMCSQPVQYEWIKKYYPELYTRIKKRVKEGRWEVFGAHVGRERLQRAVRRSPGPPVPVRQSLLRERVRLPVAHRLVA